MRMSARFNHIRGEGTQRSMAKSMLARGGEISPDKAHRSLRMKAYSAYVEFAGEEQRSMAEFMPARRGAETDAERGAPEPADEGVLSVRRIRRRGATKLCAVYAREIICWCQYTAYTSSYNQSPSQWSQSAWRAWRRRRRAAGSHRLPYSQGRGMPAQRES